MSLHEQLAAIRERAATLIARPVPLPQRQLAARAGNARRAPRRSRDNWTASSSALAGGALPQRGGAGAESARPRSGATVSADPEQEPELHRAAVGQGRVRARHRRSPSCRCRARCRAWCRVPEAGSGVTFVLLSNIVAEFVALLFPGMEVHRLLSSSASRATATCSSTRKKSTTCGARWRASWRSAATAPRCGSKPPRTARRTSRISCWSSSRCRAHDLYRVAGPVNLNRLSAIYDLVERRDLKYPPFIAGAAATVTRYGDLFERSAQRDVLLHHPFQSFAPVMDFLRQAAADPAGAGDQADAVPHRLGFAHRRCAGRGRARRQGRHRHHRAARAFRRGGQHRAWPPACRRPASHVMYGVVGYKTHAKMILVVRREAGGICAATATWAPATITRRPRAPTPTTGCSPATRPSAWTCTRSSCSSPA